MKKTKKIFRNKSIENKIIHSIVYSLFTVSFLTMFTAVIGSTLDGLIVGRFLGETCFGALGLTSPLFNLIELISSVVATGTVVTCSNLIGEGRPEKAKTIFTSGFTLCLIVGGLSAIILGFMPWISKALVVKQDAEIFLPGMYEYVRGLAPGIPAIMLSTLMIPIVQLDGDKKRVVIASVVLCLVNLSGDIAVSKLTDLGMLGIGLTTTLSYYASVLILSAHFFRKNTIFRLGLSLSGLKTSLSSGIPSLFNRAATTLRNLTYNNIALGTGGPMGVVAWATVNNLSSFLSGFPKAFGQEALVGSGVFYGEKDRDTLIRFIRKSVLLALAVIVLVIAVIFFAAPFLVGLQLSASSEAFEEAVKGLRWYGLGLLPYTLNMILSHYLQSAKKKLFTNIICFMDGFGMLILFAMMMIGIIGFSGLWYSFFLGKSAVLILSVLYICFRQKSFRLTIENLLMLPKDFDVPEEDRFLISIDSMEGAAGTSEKIIGFCENRGIDHRRSSFVGLALEEMSQIIIDEGFGDGKDHSIDIKLFIQEDQITIRLRDDCKMFDTARRAAIFNPEDPASHPAIRVLNHISRETDYYSALNVNYLLMHIA